MNSKFHSKMRMEKMNRGAGKSIEKSSFTYLIQKPTVTVICKCTGRGYTFLLVTPRCTYLALKA